MNKNTLFILNVPDFPLGYAFSHQIFSISKSAVTGGANVIILNNSIPKEAFSNKIQSLNGEIEGIKFEYLSGFFQKINTFERAFSKIKGFIREFSTLMSYRGRGGKRNLMISYVPVFLFLYYRILCWLFGYSLTISIMEYHIAFSTKNFLKRVSYYFFDRIAIKLADKILVISPNLEQFIEANAPSKKVMLIPALINEIKPISKDRSIQNKFIFCGSAEYYDIIKFIVKAWEQARKSDSCSLSLIINGNATSLQELKAWLSKQNFASDIFLQSDLTDEELLNSYDRATALLIPLMKNKKDFYRFPHKISQYLASGRPVITSDFGIVPYYLKHGLNALIAKLDDIDDFSNQMKFVLKNPIRAQEIGLTGKKTASELFLATQYSDSLNKFLF